MTDSKANKANKASKAKPSKAKSKASLPANTAENAGGDNIKPYIHPNTKINVSQAIAMRAKGMTYQQIADKFNCSKVSVYQRLQHLRPYLDPEAIQQWDSNKSKALSVAEQVLLDEITNPAKVEKASLNNIAYAFQQVYSANRLEQGKATENIGVAMLLQDSQQARDEAAELRKALLEEQE